MRCCPGRLWPCPRSHEQPAGQKTRQIPTGVPVPVGEKGDGGFNPPPSLHLRLLLDQALATPAAAQAVNGEKAGAPTPVPKRGGQGV